MVTGPGDELAASAAGRERLRASHADREQVIGTLKAAFVQGMLAKDEFDLRVGQAFASRTHAELGAVTANLPAKPTASQPPEAAWTQGEQPVLRPGPVIMAATALNAGVWAFTFLPPWPTNSEGDPPHGVISLFFSANLVYLFVLVVAAGYLVAGWREKRSSGRPPRRWRPRGLGHRGDGSARVAACSRGRTLGRALGRTLGRALGRTLGCAAARRAGLVAIDRSGWLASGGNGHDVPDR